MVSYLSIYICIYIEMDRQLVGCRVSITRNSCYGLGKDPLHPKSTFWSECVIGLWGPGFRELKV